MAKKTFLYGAAILTVSGIIAKILGAIFRIPLANIIAADGMAYYNGAYPVYVLLLTISIAGTPVAISRMVSERIAFDDYFGAHRVFKVILAMMTVVGVVLFATLLFGAEFLTGRINSLSESVYAMKAIAPSLLFVTMLSVFRGYFQGMQNMKPSAVIQVTEQFFRLGVGLTLAWVLLKYGKPFAAAGATFGATAGAIGGLLVAFLIYRSMRNTRTYKSRLRESWRKHVENNETPMPTGKIISTFLIIAIPVMIGASIMPIMNNIDLWVVTRRLADSGMGAAQVRSMYGQLTGFAGPLINLPQVITQAIAISLVPTVVTAFKTGDRVFLQQNVVLSIKTTFIVSLPCSAGLLVLAEPIMKLLYPRQIEDAVSAAPSLAILACGVAFLAIIQTLTGVLQGVEKQYIPVINLFIGACCKAVITWILTGIPSINIKGAALGTVCAYVVASLLNFIAVWRYTRTSFLWGKTLGKPLISTIVMGLVAFCAYKLCMMITGNAISTLAAILAGGIVYVVLLFATKSVTAEELELLPKGEALARIYKRYLSK